MEGNKNILQEKYESFSKSIKFTLIVTTILSNCFVIIGFLQAHKLILQYDVSVINSNSLALNFREGYYTIYNNETVRLFYIICMAVVILFIFVMTYGEYASFLSDIQSLAYGMSMQCFSIFEKRVKKDKIKMYKIIAVIFVVFIVGFLLISYKLNTAPANTGMVKDIVVEDVFNEKTVIGKDGVVEQVLEIPMSSFSDVLKSGSKLEKLDNLSILGKDYKYSHSGNGYYYFSLR